MKLAGYQPLTLIDYPGHLAAIVFTQGCPFRCGYCHNPELLETDREGSLSEQEVLDRLVSDKAMLDGVVVTGGEPTVHPDLPEFLASIKAMGLKVKLDTNGVHPRLVEDCLARQVIDFVAMDIKHTWEKYPEVIGINAPKVIDNCRQTLALLQASGVPVEFRTTLYSALHTQDDVLTIAGYLRDSGSYALQQVRYQKTLKTNLPQSSPFDLESLKQKIEALYPNLCVTIKAE
jgi:pyruvate formate lyase activating enzyme